MNDRGDRRVVSARGDAREVVVLLPMRRAREAAISVLTHAPERGEGYALVTLTPPERAVRAIPREVTLVLDVSGSMRGRKLEQAKAAGRAVLETLAPRDRFRLIAFGTDVERFHDGPVAATPAAVREARRWIDGLVAEGSTNIEGALRAALDEAPDDDARERLPVVLFLTDGAPTVGMRDPDALAELARRERGERRVFTFGVGADVNTPLVERLALEGRGTAQFVRPEEDVERAVGLVARRLTSPVATDLRIRASGVRLERVMPAGPVDLFAGEDLVVLARYELAGRGGLWEGDGREARVWFEGEGPDGPVRWETTARFPEVERENGFVPRLWATRRIGWLSAEKRRVNGPTAELDSEIRALGERWGIPTEFSSYLVLEPGMVANGTAPASPRGMIGGGRAVQLEQMVVTGATAAPAAAPEARKEAVFERARSAAAQRSAANAAEADAAALGDLGRSGETRRAGDRIFQLRDGVWTDVRSTANLEVMRVKAYSPAYFALLDALPSLRPALALGDRVRVAGRGLALEVGPEGAERLTGAELARLRRALAPAGDATRPETAPR